jgi:hypothetical protein
VDVAFQPMLDEYRGIVTLKWRLQDLQASSSASVLPVPEPLEVPALA